MDKKLELDGKIVFDLKATYGLPLEIIIDRVMNEEGLNITWPDFIEEARKNNWLDEQIFKTIKYGIEESMLERDIKEIIIEKTMLYLMTYPNNFINHTGVN